MALALARLEHHLLYVLEKEVGEEGYGLHGVVDPLHETLHPLDLGGGRHLQLVGYLLLVLEIEPVILALAGVVEAVAHLYELLPGILHRPPLLGGHQTGFFEPRKGIEAEENLGRPEDRLDVPQAAAPLLDVGFQEEDMATVPGVPFGPVGHHILHEIPPSALDEPLTEGGHQPVIQPLIAGQEAAVQEGHLEEEVLPRLVHALLDAPHPMAHIELGVPEGVKNGLGHLLHMIGRGGIEEEHEIDIGKGEELPAAVSPQGHQRQALPLLLHHLTEVGDDELVYERGVLLQELAAGEPLVPKDPEDLPAGL